MPSSLGWTIRLFAQRGCPPMRSGPYLAQGPTVVAEYWDPVPQCGSSGIAKFARSQLYRILVGEPCSGGLRIDDSLVQFGF